MKKKFQSTLPRRERQYYIHRFTKHSNFNPRSREGSDNVRRRTFTFETLISIHAPAKGATHLITLNYMSSTISIHAPAKGATVTVIPLYHLSSISIHAPAKGATVDFCIKIAIYLFQSTLPRRERLFDS